MEFGRGKKVSNWAFGKLRENFEKRRDDLGGVSVGRSGWRKGGVGQQAAAGQSSWRQRGWWGRAREVACFIFLFFIFIFLKCVFCLRDCFYHCLHNCFCVLKNLRVLVFT